LAPKDPIQVDDLERTITAVPQFLALQLIPTSSVGGDTKTKVLQNVQAHAPEPVGFRKDVNQGNASVDL
jgi:hypothetical protein